MLKLCDDIDTMAMTLLDGELAEQELHDMDLHLLACASCKAHVERERTAHQLRRQRLAAPPAPALLRARIGRALDEVDRARRPSSRSYVLPGLATLAAVAALVVFVISTRPPGGKSTGTAMVPTAGSLLPPPQQVRVGGGGLGERDTWSWGDLKFQRSGTQFLDKRKESAVLSYAVLTPDGERLSLEAFIGDADAFDLDPALARQVGGYDVWLDQSGLVVVRDGARAIILSSRTFSQDQLVALVEQSLVILHIGSDDPRH